MPLFGAKDEIQMVAISDMQFIEFLPLSEWTIN